MESDPQVKKYLKAIARANRIDQVMLRGCITGVFTALGTTVGFALLVLMATQLIRQVPVLETFMAETGLDVLVEQLRSQRGIVTTSTTSSAQPATLTYQHQQTGLKFDYPSTFTSLVEERTSGESSSVVKFTGSGLLSTLDVYVNTSVAVLGNKYNVFTARATGQRVAVDVYENGANIGGQPVANPVFVAQIKVNGSEYFFVAVGSKDTPKQARDQFVEIIETVEVK